MGIGKLMTLI
jgi:flap endonuclease-1